MSPRDYLAGLEFHGIKLGLDNIRSLLASAGNPHEAIPAVHIAGTNGKGSVTAFLDAILRASGYSVGRFTSPHLIAVNERFLVNAIPIADAELDRLILLYRGIAESMPNPPTYFEMCTAIAFQYFAEKRVDISVIEVGMGGRYDSTNVLSPVACAITNIAFDHMKYLGSTLAEIAFEKAGIVKQGVPVVVGEKHPDALDVIRARAQEVGAPDLLRGRGFTFVAGGTPLFPSLTYRGPHFVIDDAVLSLAGTHQVENAAHAVALAEVLAPLFPRITADSVETGLGAARWPCRLERVIASPPVYIDVAHNPAGIRRLVESMPPCTIVFAASSDKDSREMLAALAPIANRLILTQFEGARATSVERLSTEAEGIPHETCAVLGDALRVGVGAASDAVPLLITGSIFTAGQARQILMAQYGAAPLAF